MRHNAKYRTKTTQPTGHRVYSGRPTLTGLNRALQDPLAFWTPEMRAYDIAVFEIFGRKSVAVFDPDLVGEVLLDKNQRFERSEIGNRMLVPALGEGLLTISGQKWRAHRKVVARAFQHDALQTLVPGMHCAADALVNRLTQAGCADVEVVPEMMHTTFDVMRTMLFGQTALDYDQERVLHDVTSYLGSMGHLDVLDLIPLVSVLARMRRMRGYMSARRVRELAVDAVSAIRDQDDADREPTLAAMLIDAQEHGGVEEFFDEHVIDNIVTFVGAGHETTAIALSWALCVLSDHPALWAELQAEARAVPQETRGTSACFNYLNLHERVIKETMRLYPPVPQIARSVAKPVRLAGLTLNRGDHVSIAIEPIHHSDKLWHNPSCFNPDRFTDEETAAHHRYQYLPFGGGQHICIGTRLALWEAQVILSTLTERFDLAMPDHPVAIEKLVKVTMRPHNGVRLKFLPRARGASDGNSD